MFGESLAWSFRVLRLIGITAFAVPLLLVTIAAPADAQNRAPTFKPGNLFDRILSGSYIQTRLSNSFSDPDGDTLSYSWTANPAQTNLDVRIETGVSPVFPNEFYLRFRATGSVGRTTVTVTATDPDGLQASGSFRLTTINSVPTAKDPPYPDQTLAVGNKLTIKATEMFADADGDELFFEFGSPSEIGGGNLIAVDHSEADGIWPRFRKITLTGKSTGEATITLSGEDSFRTNGSDSFKLTVIAKAAKPAGFTVTSGDGQAVLAWADPSDSGIVKYQQRYKAGSSFSASDDSLWSDIAGSGASTTGHTVTGLTNGTEYVFQIRAVNAGGVGVLSDEAVLRLGAPLQPGGFRLVGGNAQVALSWNDPSDATVTKYQLRYKAGTSFSASDAWSDIAGSGATTTAHTVTGLTNDTTYAFQVRAVNANGAGPASETRTMLPRASNQAPTLYGSGIFNYPNNEYPAVVVGGSFAGRRLMGNYGGGFTDPDGDALTFTWSTNPAQANLEARVETLPGQESLGPYFRYRATGPVARTTLTVTGTDPYGLSVSESVYVTSTNSRPTAKNPPYPDQTLAIGNTLIVVATDLFVDPDGDEVRFVPTSRSGDGFTLVQTSLGDEINPYTLTGETAGTGTISIQGEDVFAATKWDSFQLTVIAAAATPTGLAAAAGDTQVTLSWTDPGDSGITKYQSRHKAGTSFADGDDSLWTDVAGSGASTTSHTVTGLANGTAYVFQVRTANAGGPGGASGAVTATPALAIPAAPGDLDAEFGDGHVALRWKLPTNTSEIDKVQLRWKASASLPFTASDAWTDLAATATDRTVTGLTNDTAYSFELRATNTAGAGAAATAAGTPAAVPEAPTGLAVAAGDGYVTLSWDDPSDSEITKYQLRYKAGASFSAGDGSLWTDVSGSGAGTTSLTATVPTAGTAYVFQIRAANAAGVGLRSEAARLYPSAPPTGFRAVGGDGEAALTWKHPADDNITKYQLRYKAGTSLSASDAWTDIAGSGASTVSHTVTGLTNDTVYAFQIRAATAHGAGQPSETRTVKPSVMNQAPHIRVGSAFSAVAVIELSEGLHYADNRLTGPNGDFVDPDGDDLTFAWTANPPREHLDVRIENLIYSGNSDPEPVLRYRMTGPVEKTTVTVTATDPGGLQASFSVWMLSKSASNSAPNVKTSPYPDRVLAVGNKLTVKATDVFVDPDGDEPLFRKTSPGDSAKPGPYQKVAYEFGASKRSNVTPNTNELYGTVTFTAKAKGDATVTLEGADIFDPDSSTTDSFEIAVVARAATPTGLETTTSDGHAVLTWNDPGDSGITKFQSRHKVGTGFADGDDGLWTDVPGSGASTVSHTVTGLANGTTHVFQIRAVNAGGPGTASATAIAVPALTIPAAPTGLVATAGHGQVALGWSLPTNTSEIDDVQLRWKASASLPFDASDAWVDLAATATSRTVTGLTNGTAYSFELRAVNTAGVGPAASAAATPTAVPAPAAPTGLAAAAGDAQAALTWSDPSDGNIARYQSRHKAGTGFSSGDDGLWADIAGSGTSTVSHTVTGLANATQHVFQIRAVTAGGPGPASAAVTATPALAIPAAPTGLGAATGDGQVALGWTLPTNASAIDKVQLRWKTSASLPFGVGDAWVDLAAAATSHTVTGLTNGTAYSFELRAVNAADAGPAASAAATPQDLAPSFGLASVADRSYVDGSAIAALALPAATGGNVPLSYALTPALPAGLALDTATRTVSGTPTAAQAATSYSWTATDADGDSVTLSFSVAVEADAKPAFGGASIANQDYEPHYAVVALALPAATGGNGTLAYSLTPALPAGLSLDAATRTVSGTPTAAQGATVYRWTATDADGDTATIDFSLAATYGRPAAPAGFAAQAGDTEVTLSWNDPGDGNVTGYRLRHKAGGSFDASDDSLWTDIAGSGASTVGHSVTGLANGTAYVFEIRAVNAGGPGAASGAATATPALAIPAAPTGLSAEVGDGRLVLRWTLPTNASEIDKLQLRWKVSASLPFDAGDAWTDLAATATSHTVTGLTNDVARSFELRAVNTAGAGAAATAAGTPAAVPAAPTGLAVAAGDGHVTLSWDDPSDSAITKYQLRHKAGTDFADGDDNLWTDVSGSGAATTSLTVTVPTAGIAYVFQIRAANAVGVGPRSQAARLSPSAPPTGFQAVGGDGEATLTWNDPGDSGIVRYQSRHKAGTGFADGDDGLWTDVSGSGASTVSHTVTGLTNGTTHVFQIRAVNAGGPGVASATAIAVLAQTAPAAPTGLAATAGHGQVALGWTLPTNTSAIDKVQLRWKASASLPFDASDAWVDLAATATSRTVTGLTNGTAYSFELRAVNTVGVGPAASAAATPTAVPAPAAPTGLAAAAGDAQATLTWNDPSDGDIAKYQSRHKAGTGFSAGDDGLWTDVAGSGASTVSHTVTGLANGTTHVFQIRAVTAGGSGPASGTATATPALAIPAAPTGFVAATGIGRAALGWTLPTNASAIDKLQLRWKTSASLPFDASDAWVDLAAAATSHTVTGLLNGTAYSFELRAVNAAGAGPAASAAATPQDLAPSFGQSSVADRIYVEGSAIAALALPAATGGNVPLSYALTPALPAGLALDSATRTVSGTPTAVEAATTYSWTVTDADGDSATLSFAVAVQADALPSFGHAAIASQEYKLHYTIATLTLPQASGGNGALAYSLSPALPAGLALDSAARTVSGAPTAAQGATVYNWIATDANGDTATLAFAVAVGAADAHPAAPAGFAAAVGDGRVTLSWSASADTRITGYQLRHKQGTSFSASDAWTDIAGSGASTAGHVVTGLQNDNRYVFQIRAVAGSVEGVPSAAAAATPVPPPVKPTGLTATVGNAQVTLSWDDPSNATVTRYELRHTSAASFGANDAWSAIPGSGAATTDRTVAGLANGVARRFQIRAVNAVGPGPASDEVTATPQDLAPTFGANSTLTVSAEQLRPLDQSLPLATGGDGPLTYSFTADLPAGLTFDSAAHRIAGAPTATQSATSYSFKATDADGDSATATVTIQVEYKGPPLPANFTVTPGDGQVTLSWVPVQHEHIDGYNILYNKGSSIDFDFAAHATVNDTVTSFTATGLDNGDQYVFRFVPVQSEIGLKYLYYDVTATPSAAPGQPGGVAAAAGDRRVELSWNAIATASRWDYRQQAAGGAFGAWRAIPDSGSASTGYRVTGLTNGTAYGFQVRAVTGYTATAASGTVTATPAAGPPGAVTSLAATASVGAVGLTWSLPTNTDDIDKLQVRWKRTSALPFTASDAWTDLAADATRVRATGLTDGAAYSFAVRAVNGDGAGAVATVAATPQSHAPAAPTGLTATAGLSAATLAWDDPLDATVTGYELRYTDAASFGAGDTWSAIPGSGSTTTGHTVAGLDVRTVWRFQVRAVNGSGASASAEASATLKDLTPYFGAATVADRSYRQWTPIAALTLPAATGGDGVTTYALTPDLPTGLALDAATRTVSGTPTAAQAATNYSWTATDADGDSTALTFAFTVVTWSPAAPAGFAAQAGDTEVTLSWNDPGDASVTGYRLRHKAGGSFDPSDDSLWTDIAGSGASTTGHTVTGLSNGTAYVFEVRAVNGGGPGAASAAATATPALAVPAAPSGLVAVAADGRMALRWTLPTNASEIDKLQLRWKATASLPFAGSDAWGDLSATATDHTVTGLANDTAYSFELRAVNTAGAGLAASVAGTPLPVPDAPTGLATAAGDTQATLSWTAPGDSGITGYQSRHKAGGSFDDGDGSLWTDIAGSGASTTDHTVTGLANGTAYVFQVRAVNARGSGVASAAVTATPALAVPAAPSGLVAVAADGRMALRWTLPTNASEIDKLQLRWKATASLPFAGSDAWGDLAATATDHTVTGLTNDTAYSFELRAVNTAGAGLAASVAGTPVPIPEAPTGLAAAAGDTQATLSWTDPGDSGITKYQSRHKAGGSFDDGDGSLWTDIAGSGASTTDHTVTGLTNGTAYVFQVRAVNARGSGVASSSVTATPALAVPAAPSGLVAEAANARLALRWTLPTNASEIDKLQLRWKTSASLPFVDSDAWGDLAAMATDHTVTGLTNDTAYSFELRAVNTAGAGLAASVAGTPVPVPEAPTGLAAAAGDTQAVLTWTDPGDSGITGYQSRHKAGGSFDDGDGNLWTNVAGSGASTVAHTVTGLTNGTAYVFQVRAVNARGSGLSSVAVTVTPVLPVPAAPSDLSAEARREYVVLRWQLPTNASEIDKLQLRWKASASLPFAAGDAWADLAATATEHTVTGLSNDVAYSFELRAVNTAGAGAAATVAGTPVPVPDVPTGLAAAAGDTQATLAWTDPGDSGITGYQWRHKAGTTFSASDDGLWTSIAGSGASTVGHTATGLANGTAYVFQIRAANARGSGDASSAVTATPKLAAPTAPTEFGAERGNGFVALRWSLPTNTSEIDKLQLRWKASASLPFVHGDAWVDLAGAATSHAVTGLANGTGYGFQLRAVNAAGVGPAAGVAGTPASVPDAPTGLRASVGDGRVTLDWSRSSDATIARYELRHGPASSLGSGDAWTGLDGLVTSQTVTGLANGVARHFELRAVNGQGAGPTSRVAATPQDLAPSFGGATVANQDYEQYRAVAPLHLPTAAGGDRPLTYSIAPALPAGLTLDGVALRIVGAPTATQDWTAYSLSATDADGDVATTAFQIRVAYDGPPAPAYFTATPGAGQVALTWEHQADGNLTGYSLHYQKGSAIQDGTATQIDLGAVTAHTVTGLDDGAEYAFRLRQKLTQGLDALTSETIVATPGVGPGGGPSGLTATAGDGQVELSWNGISYVTRWDYRKRSGGGAFGAWKAIPWSRSGTTRHVVDGLANGVAYDFQLRATRVRSVFAVSSVVSATPAQTATVGNGAPRLEGEGLGPSGIVLKANAPYANLRLVRAFSDPDGDALTFDVAANPAQANLDVRIRSLYAGPWYGEQYYLSMAATGPVERTTVTVTATDPGGLSVSDTVMLSTTNRKPAVRTPPYPDRTVALGGTLRIRATDLFVDEDEDDDLFLHTAYSATGTFGVWPVGDPAPQYRELDLVVDVVGEDVVTVEAWDVFGAVALDSFKLTVVGPPDAPTGLAATAGDGRATLTWTDPGDGDITGYQLRHKAGASFADGDDGLWTDVAGSGASTADHTVTGLANATQHVFQIRAVITGVAGDASGAVTATPALTAPAAPSGLSAAPGDGKLALGWELPTNTSAIDKLQLRWKASASLPFAASDAWGDLAATATSHTVTGLANGTAYSFELRAVNTAGTGPAVGAAGTPQDLAPSFGQATVADRGYIAGSAISALALPPATGGNGPVAYALTPALPAGLALDSAARTVSGTPTAAQAATTYSWTATDADGDSAALTFAVAVQADARPSFGAAAIANQDYEPYYAVAALNLPSASGGNGTLAYSLTPALPAGLTLDADSRTVSGTPTAAQDATTYSWAATDADGDTVALVFTVAATYGRPAQPAGFAASGGDGQATLSWNEPGDANVTGYRLRYKQGTAFADGDAWTAVAGSGASTTSHVVTGLQNGSQYVFQIRAVAGSAESLPSAVVDATPDMPAPALSATPGAGRATLAWSAISQAGKWQYRQRQGEGAWGAWTDVAGSGASTTGHVVTGLADRTAYGFRVRAVLSGVPGAASNEATATPRQAVSVSGSVADLTLEEYRPMTPLVLPEGAGGILPLRYALTPDLPAGLTLDLDTRTISGTLKQELAQTTYSWTVTDADSDGATLSFAMSSHYVGPGKPTGLTATPGDGQVSLAWDDPGDPNILRYALFHNKGSNPVGTGLPLLLAADATSHTVTGLDNGDQYAFKVVPVSHLTSNVFETVTATPNVPPAKPAAIAAAADDGQVALEWSAIAGVTDWQVQRRQGGGAWGEWQDVAGSSDVTTRHTVTGLTNGVAYGFRVRARLTGVPGAASNEATATPTTDPAPSFGIAMIANQVYTQGTAIAALVLPEATGGNGTISYGLLPILPAGVTLAVATRTLSGTPTVTQGATTYKWFATDTDGDPASLSFTIEVVASGGGGNAASREAFGKSLAGLAAKTLGQARATVGARLQAAPGSSNLTVAGQRVQFGPAADATGELDWRGRRTAFDRDVDKPVSWEELRRDSAFEMSFAEAGGGLEMTAWGRGGLMRFEAEQAGIGHRSEMETGWLGMDARFGDGLLMGFALSRSAGETESSDGANFSTALDGAWPYAQVKFASGAELWTVLGAGNGSVDYRPVEGAGEREALEMRLASAGGRQPLADLGALDLALEADAGYVALETAGGTRSVIGGHEVQVWQARASLEVEHEGWGLGGGSLAPFGSLAWRGDGGDWREGSGVEAGFGARLSSPDSRFALEAEGRRLSLSSGADYGGTGASLTAGVEPAENGAGLSWSASLATGMRADGASTLAGDLDYGESGFGDDDRTALEMEARYGFRLPATYDLLSPLLRLTEETGARRSVEAGVAFQAARGRVDLELTGGHEARADSADDNRIRLDLRLDF